MKKPYYKRLITSEELDKDVDKILQDSKNKRPKLITTEELNKDVDKILFYWRLQDFKNICFNFLKSLFNRKTK
jgi:hypothetical protein